FARAGKYTIELRDARHFGNADGCYILRMGRFPAARVAIPAALKAGETREVNLPELGGAAVPVTSPKSHGLYLAPIRRPGDDGSAWIPLESTRDDAVTH